MFAQEFANQIANQLRNTASHGASQTRIIAAEMPNQTTQLATERHTPA
jgi:hypothetical protein